MAGFVSSRPISENNYDAEDHDDNAPISPGDLANYVLKAGDTLSGHLFSTAGDPTQDEHLARKKYVDDEVANIGNDYVNITGDTMTGFLTLNANPTSNFHSATKNYVDTEISTAPFEPVNTNLTAIAAQVAINNTTIGYDAVGIVQRTPTAQRMATDVYSTGEVDSAIANYLPLVGGTMSGDINMNSVARMTGLPDPILPSEAVNKQYADAIAQGFHVKPSIRALDTSSGWTYDNGTAGVGATLTRVAVAGSYTVDGLTIAIGEDLLITSALDPENGVYELTSHAFPGNTVLTRREDADGSPTNELIQGSWYYVLEGTTYGGTTWAQTSPEPTTIGTDPILYTQSASMTSFTAGANIDPVDLMTNTISVVPIFPDNTFELANSVDGTKRVAFDISNVTTATTRTATMPDKDGTVAMLDDIASQSAATYAYGRVGSDQAGIFADTVVDFDTLVAANGITLSSRQFNLVIGETYLIVASLVVDTAAADTWARWYLRNADLTNLTNTLIAYGVQNLQNGSAGQVGTIVYTPTTANQARVEMICARDAGVGLLTVLANRTHMTITRLGASAADTLTAGDHIDATQLAAGTIQVNPSFPAQNLEIYDDVIPANKFRFTVPLSSWTGTRSVEVQDADGTMALLSDIPAPVINSYGGLCKSDLVTPYTITPVVQGTLYPIDWPGSMAMISLGFTQLNSALTCLAAGNYRINWSMSGTTQGTGVKSHSVQLHINGSPVGAQHVDSGSNNDWGCVAGSHLATLALNDTLKLYVSNEGNNNDIYVHVIEISAVSI